MTSKLRSLKPIQAKQPQIKQHSFNRSDFAVLLLPALLTPMVLFIDAANATPIEQIAPIESVTLYSGSATLQRSIDVIAGTRSIVLERVPANFDMQTLSIRSVGGVQVGQILSQNISGTETLGDKQQALQAQIQQLTDQIEAIDVTINAAEIQSRYLERMNSGDTPQQESTAIRLKSIRASALDALSAIHQAKIDKRDLEKKLNALQLDLQNMQSNVTDTRTLTLNVRAPESGKLVLMYQVQGAGWKPYYKAQLNTDTSKLTLERMAIVSQKSGEDWKNVKLSLSTGQPQLSPVAAEPQTWRLYYQPPVVRQAKVYAMASPVIASDMVMESTAMRASVPADNYSPPVLTQNNTFSTEFVVPTLTSVLNDGQEITVSLSEQSLPVTQTLRVAPRLDKFAVLTASTARPEGVWLSGDMQLYRDGGYVGKAVWDPDSNSQMMFSFGKDDKVKVTVNRQSDKTDTSGIISQSQKHTVKETYTIKNNHSIAMDLLVLESVPQSATGELSIKSDFNLTPTSTRWEDREGVYAWQQQLPANATFNLNLNYVFTFPKGGYVPNMP